MGYGMPLPPRTRDAAQVEKVPLEDLDFRLHFLVQAEHLTHHLDELQRRVGHVEMRAWEVGKFEQLGVVSVGCRSSLPLLELRDDGRHLSCEIMGYARSSCLYLPLLGRIDFNDIGRTRLRASIQIVDGLGVASARPTP